MTRLLRWYPQFSERYVLYRLPMVRGWAYHASSMEMDAWLQFSGISRTSRGYVGAEIDRLMRMVE